MKALSRSLISAAIIAAAGLSTAYADGGYNSSPDGFWYVGYGTGYQYTRFRTTALVDHTFSPSFDPKMNSTSNAWLNNLFIGYGHYTNDGYYYGGEFNLNIANARSLSKQNKMVGTLFQNFTIAASTQWSADLDFLFGHTIGSQNWLGYGKIGVSTTNLKLGYKMTEQGVFVPQQYFSQNYQIYGIIAGLGTRYQFAPGWDVGLEADYTYYPTQAFEQTLPFRAVDPSLSQHATFGFNPYMISAKATISYRF